MNVFLKWGYEVNIFLWKFRCKRHINFIYYISKSILIILNLPPSHHPIGLVINLILSFWKSSNLQILWGAQKLADRIKTPFLNSVVAAWGFSTVQPTRPCGRVTLLTVSSLNRAAFLRLRNLVPRVVHYMQDLVIPSEFLPL